MQNGKELVRFSQYLYKYVFFLIICQQIHTHSLTTGMKKAQMKTPNNGPPIMPYILRAIWRIKVPKNSAKNAKPIVTPPVTNAVIMLEMNILLAFYSIIFKQLISCVYMLNPWETEHV